MTQQQDKVAIRFIGRKSPFKDDIYGTKLTFESGQVRDVPPHIAKRFLKHGDLFELSDEQAEKAKKQDASDDTDEILDAAKQEQDEKQEEKDHIEDIRQRVMLSESKDELADMAMTYWQQKLDKRSPVASMRQQVVQFIDQFGIV